MKQKAKLIFVLVLLFVALGYIRDFLFLNTNIILFHKYYHSAPAQPIPAILFPLDALSYDTLYYLKYFFTILFTLLYYALSRFSLSRLCQSRLVVKILFYTYSVILLAASLAMLYGFFVNDRLQDDEYTLSRWLMGIAQSPIICLILLASDKLTDKNSAQ